MFDHELKMDGHTCFFGRGCLEKRRCAKHTASLRFFSFFSALAALVWDSMRPSVALKTSDCVINVIVVYSSVDFECSKDVQYAIIRQRGNVWSTTDTVCVRFSVTFLSSHRRGGGWSGGEREKAEEIFMVFGGGVVKGRRERLV